MQRSPIKSSSHPDLTLENVSQDQVSVRNVNTRKRRNPDEQQLEDLKSDLLKSFKEMMATEMAVIKLQNNEILQSNLEIKKQLEENAANYKDIRDRVLTLETKHEEAIERINLLETQVNVLQKQLLRNTIEIRNIPQHDNEDVQNIVKNVYNTLKIPPIDEHTAIYRRGKKKGPIVIEYQNTTNKEVLLKAVKKYNSVNKDKPLSTNDLGFTGAFSRVYISESLTFMSKKILAAARELTKNGSYKYCWASRGNILLRKEDGQPAIVINSLNQLKDFTSE